MDRPHDKHALEYYAHHWVKLASEFRRAQFGMLIRHEDLVSDQYTLIKLRDYLEVMELDSAFVEKSRVKGGVKSDSALSWLERHRAKKIVWNEMYNYGYESPK